MLVSSIRTRLTLWFTLLIISILVIFSLTINLLIGITLEARFDTSLLDQAESIGEDVILTPPGLVESNARQLSVSPGIATTAVTLSDADMGAHHRLHDTIPCCSAPGWSQPTKTAAS